MLTYNKIKVYLFDTLMPTPVLSFAVKYLNCTVGIVITASHNPKEYNVYKIYDENSCQLVPRLANKVISYVNAVSDIKNIEHAELSKAEADGLFEYVGKDVLDAFISAVETQSLYREKASLKIIYTPLHGTGNIPVRTVLRSALGAEYPSKVLEECYKKLLINQFHDILPGSHINPVYKYAIADYEWIENSLI